MLKHRSLVLFAWLCLLSACVKPKIYRAEVATRTAAEAREKVLVQELLDRKKETADLTKQVGELNRTIGNQEAEMKDLKEELNARTQKMGESSSKLAREISDLQKELASAKDDLAKRNTRLQSIQKAQTERRKLLDDLKTALTAAYTDQADVTVASEGETVALSLPDKTLFDSKGLEISTSGKALLKSLAGILTERPELDVDVVCHTDNVLPKDKSLADTWDWSLRRATNLVRLLIAEYNVNANQLTPVAKGEYYPATSNATPEGRQKNRRTVLLLRPAMPPVPTAE